MKPLYVILAASVLGALWTFWCVMRTGRRADEVHCSGCDATCEMECDKE